jgi:hypothetical protein
VQLLAVRTMENVTAESLKGQVVGIAYKHANGGSTMYHRQNCGQRDIPIEGRTASVSHLPYVLAIDPAGNVCNVPISTHRRAGDEMDAKYEKMARLQLKQNGWIVLDDPAQVSVKTDERGYRVVTVTDEGLLAEVARRRNERTLKARIEAAKNKGEVERMVEVFKAATGVNTDAMRKVQRRQPGADE